MLSTRFCTQGFVEINEASQCKFYLACRRMWVLLQKANAQQLSHANFYNQNPYSINPAYAGFNDGLEGYFDYRTQWANVAGGPEDGLMYIHKRFFGNMGLGLQVKTASFGLLGQNRISGSYAYHLTLGDKHNLME